MEDRIIKRELDDSGAFDILDDIGEIFAGAEQEEEIIEQQEEQQDSPVLETQEGEGEEQGAEELEEGQEAASEIDPDNNPKVLAEYWKSIGKLPEDFDTNNITDYEELDTAYRSHREKELEEEIENRLLSRYEEEGYTKEDLEYAKIIRQGADPNALKESVIFRNIASEQVDPETDAGRQYAEDIIRLYYADQGFKEAKINKLVEAEFEDGSFTETLTEAQGHFAEKANKIEQTEKQVAKAQAEQKAKDRETLKNSWISWLDRGEVAGAKYSKEEMSAVKKALFEPTEVVTAANGKRERVTLLEKKRREMSQNKELGFRNIVEFILGYSKEDLKEEAKKDVNSEILKGLQANKIVGTSRAPINKDKAKPTNTANIQRREVNIL
jgi:hypothetical protein